MGNFHSDPCDASEVGCAGDPDAYNEPASQPSAPPPPKPVIMATQRAAPPTALSPFDTISVQAERYGDSPSSY